MSDGIKVKSTYENTKVYLEIVKHLRSIIIEGNLKSGDKLPSERELSERLTVGRSSVREALRALELLGLIETKRGEGTFIRDFKGHQLIPLIGTFVLQDEQAKKDVMDTKYVIEKVCIPLIIKQADSFKLKKLLDSIDDSYQTVDDDSFFFKIIELADNFLILRIWIILTDYYHSLELNTYKPKKEHYIELLQALYLKDETRAVHAYENLRGVSKDS